MNYNAAAEYMLSRLRSELPDNCSYHDYSHTLDVLSAVELLSANEGITSEETLNLLRTAAVYHDCGFIYQYRANEPVAAGIARETLPDFGYTPEQIETVARLILVTALGTEPVDLLEQIVKDADFDYLGRKEYSPVSFKLKDEWETLGMHYTLPEWYALQKRFLEEHRYYTETAKRLREPVKQQHLEKIRAMLVG